jgi:indolepyruvate ferredoxin oxidoreductase
MLDAPLTDAALSESLAEAIERRRAFLVDYQDEALAERYTTLVERVRQAEAAIGGESLPLTDAVVRAWFKTLAYKDEYEVARLHTESGFLERLRRDFGGDAKIRFHLAPPILNSGVDARGRPRKREFGAWIVPLFRLLAKMRRLRGTRFDPFGMTAERRLERALIGEFEDTVGKVLAGLAAGKAAAAADIVNLYLDIRGYGPVKEEAVALNRKGIEDRLQDYSIS